MPCPLTEGQVEQVLPKLPKEDCSGPTRGFRSTGGWVGVRLHLCSSHGKTMEAFQLVPLRFTERKSMLVCHMEGCCFYVAYRSDVQKHLASVRGLTKTQVDAELPSYIL